MNRSKTILKDTFLWIYYRLPVLSKNCFIIRPFQYVESPKIFFKILLGINAKAKSTIRFEPPGSGIRQPKCESQPRTKCKKPSLCDPVQCCFSLCLGSFLCGKGMVRDPGLLQGQITVFNKQSRVLYKICQKCPSLQHNQAKSSASQFMSIIKSISSIV